MALRLSKTLAFPDISGLKDEEQKKLFQFLFEVLDTFNRFLYSNAAAYAEGIIIDTNADQVFYFGNPDTNGTWRIKVSGNDLCMQRREGGAWINKFKAKA